MFEWDAKRIGFMVRAAETIGFNEQFADRLATHIPPGATVLDAGCGLGYLSLALARRGYAVTAADRSEEALAVLADNCERHNLRSIHILPGDVFAHSPATPYEALVCCFFATVEETLRLIRQCCCGTAFLFKKNWDTHRFDGRGERLGDYTYEHTAAALRKLGVPFQSEFFTPELGQPFRSLDEASAFFGLYGGENTAREDWLSDLIRTGEKAFPYFLSAKRPVGLIRIDARDLNPDGRPQSPASPAQ